MVIQVIKLPDLRQAARGRWLRACTTDASDNSPTGSCVIRIPKAFWTEDVQQKPFELKLIAMEEISSWGNILSPFIQASQ